MDSERGISRSVGSASSAVVPVLLGLLLLAGLLLPETGHCQELAVVSPQVEGWEQGGEEEMPELPSLAALVSEPGVTILAVYEPAGEASLEGEYVVLYHQDEMAELNAEYMALLEDMFRDKWDPPLDSRQDLDSLTLDGETDFQPLGYDDQDGVVVVSLQRMTTTMGFSLYLQASMYCMPDQGQTLGILAGRRYQGEASVDRCVELVRTLCHALRDAASAR